MARPAVQRVLQQEGLPDVMDAAFQEPSLARVPFWFLRHGETDWNAQGIVARQRRYSAEPDRARAGPVGGGECCAIAASPPSSPRRCRARVSPRSSSAKRLACRWRSTPTCARSRSACRKARQMSGVVRRLGGGRLHARGRGELSPHLRRRAVAAINRATGSAAGGAGGRAWRAVPRVACGDGRRANVRTQNAMPIFCEPPGRTRRRGRCNQLSRLSLRIPRRPSGGAQR